MKRNHLFVGFDCIEGFVPGLPLTGVVSFVVQKTCRVKNISIVFEGKEYVAWYEGVKQDQLCTDKRTIVTHSEELWTSDAPGGSHLEEGSYTFPFKWILPKNLPGNYEEVPSNSDTGNSSIIFPENSLLPRAFGNERSYIRYKAVTCVELGDDSENKDSSESPVQVRGRAANGTSPDAAPKKLTTTASFNVVENFPVSALSQKAKTVEGEKHFLLRGPPCKLKVSVANGGVLFSGHKLYFRVDVQNDSSHRISGLSISVDEHVVYSALENGNEVVLHLRNPLVEGNVVGFELHGKTTFSQSLAVEIPASAAGSIRNGKHIQRHYELNCVFSFNMASSHTISVPILLLKWTSALAGIVPSHIPVNLTNIDHPTKAIVKKKMSEFSPSDGDDDDHVLNDSDHEVDHETSHGDSELDERPQSVMEPAPREALANIALSASDDDSSDDDVLGTSDEIQEIELD